MASGCGLQSLTQHMAHLFMLQYCFSIFRTNIEINFHSLNSHWWMVIGQSLIKDRYLENSFWDLKHTIVELYRHTCTSHTQTHNIHICWWWCFPAVFFFNQEYEKNHLGVFFKHRCLGPTIQIIWFSKTGMGLMQLHLKKYFLTL